MIDGGAPFGKTADGRSVRAVTLRNAGLTARIITYGATLQDLRMAGVPWPLVLGSDQLAAYEGPLIYAGAIVGPVANRIAGSVLAIGGTDFRLRPNEGPNLLHGGAAGTHARIWRIERVTGDAVALGLDIPAGSDGLPGNRHLRAEYSLTGDGALLLVLGATTDAPTPVNLAMHSYWNLDGRATTAGHRLTVAADRYTPTDAALLPLGAVLPVAGTAHDLRDGQTLSDQPRFDTNFCLSDALRPLHAVAMLTGASGVTLHLATTAPGLQVYDGANLAGGPFPGLTGQPYGPFAGIALEPQMWPDAPHHPAFPDIILHPGAVWQQQTRMRFTRANPAPRH